MNALLSVPTLPLTRESGLRAGMLLARLRDRGHAIEIRDAMQAGICIEAGLPLVTRNRAQFEHIDELEAAHPSDWPRRAAR